MVNRRGQRPCSFIHSFPNLANREAGGELLGAAPVRIVIDIERIYLYVKRQRQYLAVGLVGDMGGFPVFEQHLPVLFVGRAEETAEQDEKCPRMKEHERSLPQPQPQTLFERMQGESLGVGLLYLMTNGKPQREKE